MRVDWQQPVNWDCSLTRGLVSWWMVGENPYFGGGVWRDLCGRNHGTLTNMDPATDWQGPQGRLGGFGCLDFDGSNDHIVTGDLGSSFESKIWTYSIWFRTSATNDNTYPFSMGNTADDLPLLGVRFEPGGSGKVQGLYRDNAGNLAITAVTSAAMNDGAWHHLILSADGTNLNLTVDSQTPLTFSLSGITTVSLNTSAIGALKRTSTVSNFTGQLDNAMAFDRFVSASEVLALYNDSRRGHPEMLNLIRPTWYVEQAGGGGGGRTTFNTRSHPLGIRVGMNWRVAGCV